MDCFGSRFSKIAQITDFKFNEKIILIKIFKNNYRIVSLGVRRGFSKDLEERIANGKARINHHCARHRIINRYTISLKNLCCSSIEY